MNTIDMALLSPLTMLHPVIPTSVLVMLIAWRLRPLPSRPLPSRQSPSTGPVETVLEHDPRRRQTIERQSPRWLPQRRPLPVDAANAARWCDAISRELRSGATLAAAVADAECSKSVEAATSNLRFSLQRGHGLRNALAAGAEQLTASPSLRMVLMVLTTLAEHGGPAAEPIDRVAAALRMRDAADAERRNQSAQARWSAAAMTLLPLGTLALLITTSSSVRTVVTTPLGAVVVACGCGLNALGWVWMRRIVAGGQT